MTAAPAPLVYVALHVPVAGHAALHMTVCVMPMANWNAAVLEETKQLAAAILPLDVGFDGRAMFGDAHNVPVRLMHVVDPAKKLLMDAYYRRHFVPRPGEEETRRTQTFHVSLKGMTNGEASALADMALVDMFVGVAGQDWILWVSASAF